MWNVGPDKYVQLRHYLQVRLCPVTCLWPLEYFFHKFEIGDDQSFSQIQWEEIFSPKNYRKTSISCSLCHSFKISTLLTRKRSVFEIITLYILITFFNL